MRLPGSPSLNHSHDRPRFHRGPGGPQDGFGPEGGRRHGGGFGGPGGGPRGPRRAGRGDVRLAILSLLSEAPSNGYGLIKTIAERTNGAWRPSPGSVYPTLQQLVDEALVVATGDGRGTEYALSDAGTAFVAENGDDLARAWAASPGHTKAEASLHESIMKLRGALQQLRHSATDAQREAATATLDETRRALYLILAD